MTRCAAVLGTVSSRTPKRRLGQSRSRHGEPRGRGPWDWTFRAHREGYQVSGKISKDGVV